jgi:hypothetical protein
MELWCGEASYISLVSESWYKNLHHGAYPENINSRETRVLKLKYVQYRLINLVLFQINYDGVLLRCLEREYANKFLKELHDGPASGNFTGNTTTHKMLTPMLGTVKHVK